MTRTNSKDKVLTLANDALPPGWVSATIPELVARDGIFVDGDWVESKDQNANGGVRLIQLADIGDGAYRDRSARFLTHDTALRLSCTFLQPGDVLVARMPEPLGRACTFPGADKPSVTVVDVCVVRPGTSGAYNRWLMQAVNSPQFRSAVMDLQSGTTRQRISRSNLATIELPAPPLAEQHRIVAAIEQQFTRLDAGVAALRRVRAALKRYRVAVLKAAVEGQLTEAWRAAHPDAEPASALLTRILAERRARWEADLRAKGKDPAKVRYAEPAVADTTNLPALPEGWYWATVEQVGDVGTGATPLSTRTDYYDGGTVPWITSGALNAEVITEAEEFITTKALIETNAKVFPRGTLVVAMYGEGKTRGKVAELQLEAATNQACAAIVFRPTSEPCRAYVKVFLLSNYDDMRRLASGGVQPNLNLGMVKATTVPFPPIAEQVEIVAEVERRLSVVNEVETAIAANLKRAERLRQSILERAFSGRLVPQDPRDEPASALLARIRREREAHAANGSARRNARNRDERGERGEAGVVEDAAPAAAPQARLWGEG